MNQEKIGKFIAKQRKLKELTQEELAEKLGITKNAVSKWERGLCLMDMQLLEPLSGILEVSINEILAGEKIETKDIEKKSEENIIKLTELVNLKSMKYGVIGMTLFSIILMFISFFKNIPMATIVSLLCAYDCVTFLSRYKIKNDKNDLIYLNKDTLEFFDYYSIDSTIDLAVDKELKEKIEDKICYLEHYQVKLGCIGTIEELKKNYKALGKENLNKLIDHIKIFGHNKKIINKGVDEK